MKNTISFAKPVTRGTILSIGEDKFPLFVIEGNTATYFLSALEEHKNKYTFTSISERDGCPVSISFPNNHLFIETAELSRAYEDITKEDFVSAFISSIEENALYWVASSKIRYIEKQPESIKEEYLALYNEKIEQLINRINEYKKRTS